VQERFTKPLWGETSHFKSSDFNCRRFHLCLRLEKEEPMGQLVTSCNGLVYKHPFTAASQQDAPGVTAGADLF